MRTWQPNQFVSCPSRRAGAMSGHPLIASSLCARSRCSATPRGRLFGLDSVAPAAPTPGDQPVNSYKCLLSFDGEESTKTRKRGRNPPRLPSPAYEGGQPATTSANVKRTRAEEKHDTFSEPAQRPASALTFAALPQLSGMFAFPDVNTAAEQTKPGWLLSQLTAFVQDLALQPDVAALWAGLTPAQLSTLTATVQLMNHPGTGLHIEWLPEFGCALVPLAPPSAAALQPDCVALYLVAPDGWTFGMHSCPGKLGPTSCASTTTWIYSGIVAAHDFTTLLGAMHTSIREQQELRKKDKQAEPGAGRKSHFQRTPAFIQSAVQHALLKLSGAEQVPFPPPKGGFTDVGLHTGTKPKATTWPLLQVVFKAVMELRTGCAFPSTRSPTAATSLDLQQLFDQTVLQFQLWIMQQLLQQLTPKTVMPAAVNACMTVLQSVAGKAAQLAVAGVDVAAVEAACTAARQQVDEAVAAQQRHAAADYELPANATAAAGRWRLPQGVLPPELPASAQQQGLDAACARAAANLGSLPIAEAQQPFCTLLNQLLQQLSGCGSTATDVQMQHSLRSTERALFQLAASGFNQAALSAYDVPLLQSVVDSYRVVSTAFRGSSAAAASGAAMLRAELRSREKLVAWVAYCLIHQAAAAAHPLVLQYGVALNWQDLRHLLLTDRAATDAALGVGEYLRQHGGQQGRLFHLTDQRPTLSFAASYAAADSSMCSMLSQLEADAAARMDQHWEKVQKQQQQAQQLRRDIEELKQQVRSHENTMSYTNTWDSLYSKTSTQLSQARSSLSNKQISLKAAETPPPAVIQPLPRRRSPAWQWLFLLHMPDLLRSLARASCLAQQLLLPQPLPEQVQQQLLVEGLKTSLPAHFNEYQAVTEYHRPIKQYQGSDGAPGNILGMSLQARPSKVEPDHIDSFHSREDGVWFPDSLTPVLAWQGSACSADVMSGSFFDPFAAIDSKLVVENFSAKLPGSYSSLQWAMFQYGSIAATAADRGTAGLCSQDRQPDDLSKPSYLACTALRSFPHQQLQRLCGFLRDRELPLDHPAVQLLVQQTLYHLGELVSTTPASSIHNTSSNDHNTVMQAWRTGWEQPGGVLEALCFELQQLASELNEKPRDHDSVLLLGQLAAYLSDWNPSCKAVAQQFAAMTSRYAGGQLQQEIDVLVSSGSDEAQLAELKAKQTRWRAMGLLCFAAGPLDSADVRHMLKLMLLIKHGDVYTADSKTAAQLADLRVLCHDVMARRLPEVMAMLQQHPQLLTAAAAAILECLQQQPGGPAVPKLQWVRLSSTDSNVYLASFQAVGSDRHLYSINVLDGTLLFDGNPPGRLPNSILQHRLYARTFGASNHEVKTTADGQLETIRPIAGCYYRFNLSAPADTAETAFGLRDVPSTGDSQQLIITELDPTQAASGCGVLELQLLDHGADGSCAGWGGDLPVRLREMHSHWFDRRHGFIVLRPKEFNCHAPHFLIGCSPGPAAATYNCFEVPSHLQQHHWTVVLSQHAVQLSARQLVLPDAPSSRVLRVLSKFEEPSFIHAFIPGTCPDFFKQKPTAASKQASAACGQATAGMVWQLPRCGLEFELTAAGSIMSLDHRGYSLSSRQLLVSQPQDHKGKSVHYTLPEFQQYLVLQAQPQDKSNAESLRPDVTEQLVLIPSGRVVVQRFPPGSTQQAGGSIRVQLSSSCNASLKVFKYNVHARFAYLTAHCATSRLQLACLYAASSTLLPEPGSQLTGAQAAMQLVRHSWTNTPLDSLQHQHLQDTSSMGGFLAPALRLLCTELAASAAQLQHLHVPEVGAGAAARRAGTTAADIGTNDSTNDASSSGAGQHGGVVLDTDAVSQYVVQARTAVPAGFPASPRQQLTADEESWLMHTGLVALSTAAHTTPDWQKWGRYQCVSELSQFPVASDYVQRAEAALLALVQTPQHPQQLPAFPLQVPDSTVPVAQEMMSELQHSWDCHHKNPEAVEVQSLAGLHQWPYSLAQVRRKRRAAESYLLQHLRAVPSSTGPAGVSWRLLVASAAQPTAAPTDLLALAWGPLGKMLSFNPFLSEAACAALHQGVLLWLQLCVLEDRRERIVKLASAGEEYTPLLIRELRTVRIWDPSRHPQWLVFEVEGHLQIRPAQYTMAQTLLAGSSSGRGPIGQLNMGEGKTRVILPMMILQLADGQNLVRVNFLSELLNEGCSHLQQYLTSSVLGRKVLTMPFHRGIQVDTQTLGAMQAALAYCQQVGGVLIVAPEHRNSMRLKTLELALSGKSHLADQLHQLLEGMAYYDILDESDAVLHHRHRQLVYAWGDTIPLPGLQSRVDMVQSLLLVLSRLVDEQASELSAEGLALRTGAQAGRKPGSFCGLQLLPGQVLDTMLPRIQQLLATELIEDPPLQDELGWLSNLHAKLNRKAALLMLNCLADRGICAVDDASLHLSHPDLSALPKDKQHQVLAARGLLACGLLAHCLQSRHRVDFGVNRSPSAKKRLAVPYRAADLPSQRSEFSQPDVALVYSHLAYYGDGLSRREFKQAVQMLLSRGPSEQSYHYKRWLAQGSASGKQAAGATAAFDAVDKVDANNTQLMSAMWSYFSHNMEVINYWLATCVLPVETRQYPSRLEATAWHLAQNPAGHITGFSGTNDSHRLLPLQVQQVSLDAAPELEGTNGKMLDMLLRCATYKTLQMPAAGADGAKASTPVWQLLLQQALQLPLRDDISGADAIIDCGALLAGVDLRSAAEFILVNMPAGHRPAACRYRGVTYFCAKSGSWVILDSSGRLAPKGSSHLRESETLAIFDDARCRGSDLKLRQSAVGLLTLAAGMPKDKLMQAAGRLRQLGRGQKLVVVGLPDISSKIVAAAAAATAAARRQPPHQPDMATVLSWVMANTVASTLSGVTMAAAQGMHFAATYTAPPELCVTPDKLSLEDLYGSSKVVEPVDAVLAGVAKQYTAHVSSLLLDPLSGCQAEQGQDLGAAAVDIAVQGGSSGGATSEAESMSVDDEDGGSGSTSSDDASNTPAGSLAASAAAAARVHTTAAADTDDVLADIRYIQQHFSKLGADTDDVLADIRYIQQHFSKLGAGHSVLAGAGADEECERELEQEEEEEVEVAAAAAATEADWDWESAFTANSTAQLRGCHSMQLRQALQLASPSKELRSISWSPKVLASYNFVHSIKHSQFVGPGLSDYMRPVAGLLCFPGSGELLLLSEREADALQKLAWDTAYSSRGGVPLAPLRLAVAVACNRRQQPNLLMSLSYLRLACTVSSSSRPEGQAATTSNTGTQQPLFLVTQLSAGAAGSAAGGPMQLSALLQQQLSDEALVSVQLFAGSVMHGSDSQRQQLHNLMRGRKEAAQELVGWRGKLHMLPRSDLDRACADGVFC